MTNILIRSSMILSTLRDLFTRYEGTCREVLHPHQSSCVKANLELGFNLALACFKLYTVLYLIFRTSQGKYSITPLITSVLQSTVFFAVNGLGLTTFICLFYKIFGSLYKFNFVLIPVLCSASLAYPIETRSRRRLVTPYMLSHSVNAFVRILVSRNYLPSIPYLDVLLFMLVSGRACARLSTRVSTTGFNDSVFMLLTNPMKILRRNSYSTHQIMSFLLKKVLPESNVLKIPILLTGGCAWGLLIGLSYNTVSLLVSKVNKLLSSSREEGTGVRRERRYNFRIPVLLAAYIGLFHLCRTVLRNVTPLSDSISGLIAGSAISIYRFPFLSLYLFIKELQSISKSLMLAGYLPRIPYFNYILYVIATDSLIHFVLYESEHVNRGYIHFILKLGSSAVLNLQNNLKDF